MSFIRMKKITSYILLFIYSSGLLVPISPVISDVLAHTFWRAQHLATVHCVNGKYHVHYELYKAGKSDSKGNNSVKSDETLSIHIQPMGNSLLFSFSKEVIHEWKGEELPPPFVKISGPPPRCA